MEVVESSLWGPPGHLDLQAITELRPRVDTLPPGVEARTADVDHLEGAEPLEGEDVLGAAVEAEDRHDVLVDRPDHRQLSRGNHLKQRTGYGG